jgi:2-iminobutanoate/2-iminopropanoate deaminase
MVVEQPKFTRVEEPTLLWNSVVISVETANEENMAKYAIQSKRGAPPRGAYSQGWRAGDFIFVTGTGPIDPSTGNLVGNTIEQQTRQTIDNISAILEADGASLLDVVKVTVHLSDTSHFARYNSVYAQRFSQPYPVRTTVGSDLGHTPGMLIEIDCIAYNTEKTSKRQPRTSKKQVARRRKVAFRTLLNEELFPSSAVSNQLLQFSAVA